jgi:hypothetical protein
MATVDKRLLKAFVRTDGSGRIIAGSLILRQKMPKIGKWREIQAYQCCDPDFTGGIFIGPGSPFTTSTTSTTGVVCNTLGLASTFAIIGSSTITNVGATTITGDLGLFPGASVTGFPPGVVVGVQQIANAAASLAKSAAQSAFTCLSGLSNTGSVGADIGGTTVTPGVYSVPSSLGITGTVNLDGGGNPNAVFVFHIPSTLTTAAASVVNLINGTKPCNVYWIVGSSATIGTTTTMKGVIIAQASVTLTTGATLTGNAFALTGAVTMDSNTITDCACTINPC